MKRIVFLLCLFCWTLPLAWAQDENLPAAQEPQTLELPVAEAKSPILELKEGYQIYPVDRLGNSLYHNKERIFSRQGFSIRGILPIKQGLMVWGQDAEEAKKMDFVEAEGQDGTLTALEGGCYKLQLKGGITRLYQLLPNGVISDLLPTSNTAGNLVYNGKDLVAFSHITGGQQIQSPEGKTLYQYSFKLHWVKLGKEDVVQLPKTYTGYSTELNLHWIKENQLQVTNGDGQVDRLTLR
ncbi:MAG: hypothetical protein A2600_05300 [Candidatus Lambdaproteobacteria bacterium RIFOXYD1_FULL_56_27]|uniref:Uncharacterized protein n=1 Tax=Candidatus Lambdaproteobacteria bacterium RIFOXYD2_FULL_56_26 TaxID=1817773 RepID=A0A1F6GRF8_9PROT|nr:MAG: hypothetical protein A2426_08155 [Candidatus Lambdaproteobacteria bacterium RIFOXYC1_FULL_56_13]OGH00766.1 MAG: hypothetical protein A2557_03585 [Candidatus Lambdaproteobacteria bacterium RIFOXYD2_FULL_56_26]OGH09969.1 MAG: hypothetical protein A2600_05300 [Candidatus Lambdaproteobacteria bacterium RIFOXYD1_FULL_56_27]